LTFLVLEAGFVVAFDRGLPTAFVSFFAVAFFVAAVFAFAAELEPVKAFFAGARLDAAVVFLVGAAAFALPASVFLGAAGFLAVVALVATGFFLVGAAAAFVAGLVAILEAGLEFSLEAPTFALGVSLTLPEGPLGKAKIPFSAPVVIARFN